MAKTTTNSNLVEIKDALIYAHDELHNRRALSEDDFTEKALSVQQYTQWCDYVEELRLVVAEYNKLSEDKEATDKQLQTALGKVWSAWRSVVKEGTESEYNKNFFIRKADAEKITNFCGLHAMDTARGKQFTTRGKADFRKYVETLIGIRMAGNAVLDDEKRDLISDYESAERTIKKFTEALEDSKDKKGNEIYGLKTKVTIAENIYKKEEMFCEKYKASEAEKKERLAALQKNIDDAKKAVKEANKAITKATDTKNKLEADYRMTIALLKSVGDYK